MKSREKVPFRLIWTPCCHTLLCWVNPRMPSYCPECGKHILVKLKFEGHWIEATEAWLEMNMPNLKEFTEPDNVK